MITIKTGTSMGGSLINTNKVKSIKCNCNVCCHHSKDTCEIYGYKPSKNNCIRYSKRITTNMPGTRKAKKMTKSERIQSFKDGLIDKTIL